MHNTIKNMAIVAGLVSALLLVSLTATAAFDDQSGLLAVQPTPVEVILRECEDTYIEVYNANDNFCAEPLLLVRGEGVTSALLRFDVSSIPSNATIVEAYVETYADPSSNSEELEVSVFGMLKGWVACEATWNAASDTAVWQEAGASGSEDRAAIPADTAIAAGWDWYYHNVTKLVQNWVLDANSNKGLLLCSTDARYPLLYQFSSADSLAEDKRPRLRVKYVVTGEVPTPVPPLPTWATTVITLQQALDGYTGCSDTYIDSDAPNGTHGQRQVLLVKGRGNASSLIKFDVSSLPTDAVIFEAYLQLRASGDSAVQRLQVASHAVTRGWDADEATWLNATGAEAWEEAGCTGSTDRAEIPTDREMLHGPGWCQFNVTDIVQEWLDNGSSNKGLLLESYDERWAEQYMFHSCDHVSAIYYPRLMVTYARSPEAPTPTSTPTPTETPTPTSTLPAFMYQLYLPIIFRAG